MVPLNQVTALVEAVTMFHPRTRMNVLATDETTVNAPEVAVPKAAYCTVIPVEPETTWLDALYAATGQPLEIAPCGVPC